MRLDKQNWPLFFNNSTFIFVSIDNILSTFTCACMAPNGTCGILWFLLSETLKIKSFEGAPCVAVHLSELWAEFGAEEVFNGSTCFC